MEFFTENPNQMFCDGICANYFLAEEATRLEKIKKESFPQIDLDRD